ncbi:hypothetical protein PS6_006518 [Mucor atramentarius]
MNASSASKKTRHSNNNNNKKKKKQRKQIKPKHKKKPSPSRHTTTTSSSSSSTTTSIAIATSQPTLQDVPIVFVPTATPSTLLPNSDDSPFLVADQDQDPGFYQVEETNYMASAAAIHKMEDTESITASQQPKPVSTATQVTQIAAPVIGVFGGIALIAAAMFYVVRKRKRNSMLVQDLGSKKLDFDDDKSKHYLDGEMHDISLLDDEDEAIAVMAQPPKLTPAANNTTRHYFNNPTIINVPENHPVNNPPNMTDNSNSSHALMSPISSVFENPNHISSFLMIAERQQLQHQRPSILDHFSNNTDMKPSRSSPIETYKAQLTELAVLDNDDNDDDNNNDDQDHNDPSLPPLLPFSTVIDLTEVY